MESYINGLRNRVGSNTSISVLERKEHSNILMDIIDKHIDELSNIERMEETQVMAPAAIQNLKIRGWPFLFGKREKI